jgi:hypothetical protein
MVQRSVAAVLEVGRIARSLGRVKDLLNPQRQLAQQLLLRLESLKSETHVQLHQRHRQNLLSKSKAKARDKVTATRRSVVVVGVVALVRAMVRFVILQRLMPRSSSAVKAVSAMVDQLAVTSCVYRFVMESPRWRSWKVAA